MSIVVGQGQAEHEGVGVEAFLQIVDDGDGAALAEEERVGVKEERAGVITPWRAGPPRDLRKLGNIEA